jgi:hypothetical protein
MAAFPAVPDTVGVDDGYNLCLPVFEDSSAGGTPVEAPDPAPTLTRYVPVDYSVPGSPVAAVASGPKTPTYDDGSYDFFLNL